VILPIANVAEEEGTFTNRDGREQRYYQAKPAPACTAGGVVLGQLVTLGPRGGVVSFFLIASRDQGLVVFNLIMVGVRWLTLFDRRVLRHLDAGIASGRTNRVGPQGLFQPAADGLKNFLKEETSPGDWRTQGALHASPPIVSFVPALLDLRRDPLRCRRSHQVGRRADGSWPISPSASSISWQSARWACTASCWRDGRPTTKLRAARGLRASAQMISYEIALGMSTIALAAARGQRSRCHR